MDIKNREKPLVIAHGEAKLLKPENTNMASDYVYEKLSIDVFELDLQLTKDNKLIATMMKN